MYWCNNTRFIIRVSHIFFIKLLKMIDYKQQKSKNQNVDIKQIDFVPVFDQFFKIIALILLKVIKKHWHS